VGTEAKGQQLDKNKEYTTVCVAFYNLENLFDTIADPDTNKILQEEFTPEGPKRWDSKKYKEKLENMSRVISEIGTDVTPDGAAIIGFCELENKEVIEDLIAMPKLKDRNYKVVHYHSPDKRGVDVALIYQPKYFKVTASKSYALNTPDDPDFKTRAQLLVSGIMDGEKVSFVVNHWPSKSGGEKRSRPKRIAAAQLGRHIVDSLLTEDAMAKVIYMGDLNDEPESKSVKEVMNCAKEIKAMKPGQLYNPMEKLNEQGIGSHAWRDNWSIIDQMLFTPGLLAASNDDYYTYRLFVVKVFNKEYLRSTTGSWQGYPFRSFSGDTWQGGYSDHFPVYTYLVREKR
jgi:endonuclease/exonuclease/phosphatase family metal-dependent hydrolase